MTNFDTYLSPFTWRYGSPEMRHIWSENEKRRLWREIWLAMAEVQSLYGLVRPDQLQDLRRHVDNIDMDRSLEIEAEIHHDLMAELKVYASQCPVGGGALHQGATSMDIEDNADVLRIRAALDLTLAKLRELLLVFADLIERWADHPVMAYTHLQPAEPTTLGYRFAIYAQDLLIDWKLIEQVRTGLKGKGFKGAVGTSAAYAELLGQDVLADFEERLSKHLELDFFLVASQVYPRKQDYQVVSALAGLGSTLYKFAFDLRILQSPLFGEWMEPFGKKQVGSSAMPFKRNPINSEKIDSLARSLAQIPRQAWDNAAHSLLERTLDDSANRRTFLPEAFLICDELLQATRKIAAGLQLNQEAMRRNLEVYGPFAGLERVLMALSKAGADRQEMHERLREHAMSAWGPAQRGEANPLEEIILADEELARYLDAQGLKDMMKVENHVGNAPARARALAQAVKSAMEGEISLS